MAAPGQERPILRGVVFSLRRRRTRRHRPVRLGQVDAGAGAGRRLAAVRGTIRLDGAALDQWRRTALGRDIGYLPQDIELFDGTVARTSRASIPCRQRGVIAAARAAGVHDMILHLPNGYDTRSAKAAHRCRPASANAWRWPARSMAIPSWSCWTSRTPTSMPRAMRRLTEAIGRARARRHRHRHRPPPGRAGGARPAAGDGRRPGQAFGPKDEVLIEVGQHPAGSPPDPARLKVVIGARRKRAERCRSNSTRLAEPPQPRPRSMAFACYLQGAACRGGRSGRRSRRLGCDRRAGRRGAGARALSWSTAMSRRCSTRPAASVGEIRVRDGDRVDGGDSVLRLDETVTRANLQVITKQLDELAVRACALRPSATARHRSNPAALHSRRLSPKSPRSSPANTRCSKAAGRRGPDRRRNCASASRSSTRRSRARAQQRPRRKKSSWSRGAGRSQELWAQNLSRSPSYTPYSARPRASTASGPSWSPPPPRPRANRRDRAANHPARPGPAGRSDQGPARDPGQGGRTASSGVSRPRTSSSASISARRNRGLCISSRCIRSAASSPTASRSC